MNLDRIVVAGEGPADLQIIPVLVERLADQSGCRVGHMDTYVMKDFRVPTFQKKVLAILNQEPNHPVVIVVDRDGERGRLATLQEGRAKAGDPSRCVIGLAVEMLEAWLLADPQAWKTVFPKSKDIPLPKKPELSWGKMESNKHPKRQLQAAFEACNVTDSREAAAYRVQLARAIDLGRLAKVCPAGFGALANEIQSRWFSG
ncbi:DUF4276 family protein [bacterium]|nr:DUF4276 family protein [bacterium]